MFRKFDSERTGQIRLVDFQQAFGIIPTRLNNQEISQIGDEFDPKHEGLIVYQRFLNTLDDYVTKKRSFEDILKRLEKFCMDKNISFESRIQKVDPRDTKILTKDDFLGVLNQISFNLTPIECQTLCDELPKSKDGFLDLRYLVSRLPRPKPLVDLPIIYEKVKTYIKTSRMTITQVFAKFDKNGDGNLGPYEFSQALSTMGISELGTTEITLIIQDLDKDKDGKISVTEFADKLGMSIDTVQTVVSHEFFRKISKFLKNKGQTAQDFFIQYDYDRNNSLNKNEFSKMLANLNLELSSIDIEKLYNEIDINKDGRVTFMEFSSKYDQAIAAIEKRDDMNKQKLIRTLKGKHPKDVFKTVFDPTLQQTIVSIPELTKGINFLGLNFTENDIDHIVDEIVKNKKFAVLDDLNVYFTITPVNPSKTPDKKQGVTNHWAEK